MLNLIKYELRKTLGLKGIILVIIGILELVYLFGLFADKETPLAFAMSFLVLTTFAGLVLIGVYSVHLLNKDLNTKQSYMLFMTPNNSYKILGAKVIENSLSLLLGGAFFVVLGGIDISLLIAKYGSIKDVMELATYLVEDFQYITPELVITAIFTMISSWIYTITVAFLAVVICATFLNGRKHNGLLSFIIFLVISGVVSYIVSKTMIATGLESAAATNYILICVNLGLSAVFYVVTAWIMENYLSV
jgi:hypothetical protein